MQFDSAMLLNVNFRGQIVCYNRPAITTAPRSLLPKDTWAKAVITDSNFFFSAAVTGAAEAVVDFQVGVGGNILNSNFHIVEVNGTAVYQGPPSVDGFRVLGAGAFDWNYVTSHHVHAITGKLFNGAIKNNTIRVQGPQ